MPVFGMGVKLVPVNNHVSKTVGIQKYLLLLFSIKLTLGYLPILRTEILNYRIQINVSCNMNAQLALYHQTDVPLRPSNIIWICRLWAVTGYVVLLPLLLFLIESSIDYQGCPLPLALWQPRKALIHSNNVPDEFMISITHFKS